MIYHKGSSNNLKHKTFASLINDPVLIPHSLSASKIKVYFSNFTDPLPNSPPQKSVLSALYNMTIVIHFPLNIFTSLKNIGNPIGKTITDQQALGFASFDVGDRVDRQGDNFFFVFDFFFVVIINPYSYHDL